MFACGGSNCIMAKAVTDFPEPDSPTRPSAAPFFISRLTSSTALIEDEEELNSNVKIGYL